MSEKFVDITPDAYKCTGGSCPSIHRSEDGTRIIIIGEIVSMSDHPELTDKIGIGEMAVEIDAGLYEGVASQRIAELEMALTAGFYQLAKRARGEEDQIALRRMAEVIQPFVKVG